MVEFPGMGQNFPKLEETPLKLKLAKNPKEFRKLRDSTIFFLRTLQNFYILD